MKFCLLALLTLAAVLPAQAQLSGPIIRDLGNHYYLVQCNLQQLQPDQQVNVLRNGITIAQGKVRRAQQDGPSPWVQCVDATSAEKSAQPPTGI